MSRAAKTHKGLISTNLVRQAKIYRYTEFVKKIRCSISPSKFRPNLCDEIPQTLFAFRPICAPPKKASHPVCAKKPRVYVDETTPDSIFPMRENGL